MRKRLGLPDLNVWVIRCIHGFSLEISSVRYIYTSKKLRTFVNLLIRRKGLFAYLFLTIVFGFLLRAFVQSDFDIHILLPRFTFDISVRVCPSFTQYEWLLYHRRHVLHGVAKERERRAFRQRNDRYRFCIATEQDDSNKYLPATIMFLVK